MRGSQVGSIAKSTRHWGSYRRDHKARIKALTLPNSIGDLHGLFEDSIRQDQWFGPDHPATIRKRMQEAWDRYFLENAREQRDQALIYL